MQARTWGTAAAIGFWATGALAGVQITSEMTFLGDNKTTTSTMSLAPQGVRVEVDQHVMLFQADGGKVYMLDPKNQTYFDFSGVQHAAQSDMVQQRLANLPPEQRQKVEAMMAAHGAPGAAPAAPLAPATFEKGESKTVGSWSCTVYHESRGGKHTADLCMVPIAGVGLTAADIAPLKSFAETMGKTMQGPRQQDVTERFDFDAQTKAIGFVGMPVEVTTFRDDQPRTRTTFKTIDHVDLPADQFQIPAGYTPRPMMGGGPPGGAAQ
ncbi:MAG TPA: DUF4412 domain-containing protein [Stellaceae bacterium]|nr:DUF4412 domain-containing protein [Stellaceae bacterium]